MPLSTLRVLVMMVGELEFEDFVNSSKNQDAGNPFSSVAYTFFFLCLFLMSVGLMNLLVRKYQAHVIVNKLLSKPMITGGTKDS